MQFLCYPKCTTCQKAKRWLEEQGISFEMRDLTLQTPSLEELRAWWKQSALPLKRFFNTSGLLYRSLNLKEKLSLLSEEEMLMLLSSDGMLIKRPLLVCDGFVLVGFREAEWQEKLK